MRSTTLSQNPLQLEAAASATDVRGACDTFSLVTLIEDLPRMHRPSFCFPALLVFAPLLMVGCGPDRRPEIETAPVSGTIQLDGRPLSDAQVNFLTDEYAGVATTDASGKYELEAQPGENIVYVVKYDSPDPDFDETMMTEGDEPGGGPKQLLPDKFSDPDASELRFTVPDTGSNEANFDLTRN